MDRPANNNSTDLNAFQSEHLKRERHIQDPQRRAWADGMLARLPDSIAYQRTCSPQARLAEQLILNEMLDPWLARRTGETPFRLS